MTIYCQSQDAPVKALCGDCLANPCGAMQEEPYGRILRLEQDRARLIDALEELRAAESEPYPYAEQGEEAQTAWCERKAKAHADARALLRSLNERGE